MIRILTVEDEKPISNLLRISLEKAGYSCTCAYDGAEAAEFLENGRYDLILLDIMLPEIDGFELMEYIRPMEIPVIFITAKGSVDDKVKGLRLGAEDYIVKPFEIAELLARVDVVLRRYQKNKAVFETGGLVIDTCSMQVKWGGEYRFGSKTVDLHVQRLRRKTGWENILKAVNKVGYRLEV